jgi:DNA ligase (NAD+)
MEKLQAEKKIDELKNLIKKFDYSYYTKAESLVSDFEYDKLFAELISLEKQFPELITDDSPTQRISDSVALEFTQIEHKIPMLSLSNTYNSQDVRDFDKRIFSNLEGKNYEYCAEMKFDGVSISLRYLD